VRCVYDREGGKCFDCVRERGMAMDREGQGRKVGKIWAWVKSVFKL
jgi:hypothetical protein